MKKTRSLKFWVILVREGKIKKRALIVVKEKEIYMRN
jgi:hypothetical protein